MKNVFTSLHILIKIKFIIFLKNNKKKSHGTCIVSILCDFSYLLIFLVHKNYIHRFFFYTELFNIIIYKTCQKIILTKKKKKKRNKLKEIAYPILQQRNYNPRLFKRFKRRKKPFYRLFNIPNNQNWICIRYWLSMKCYVSILYGV